MIYYGIESMLKLKWYEYIRSREGEGRYVPADEH